MKGVSQILTSTLILAVAVSVAGVYSNWAPNFAGDITGQTADQTNRDIKCRNAALTIDSAEYDLSGNVTLVTLRNSGTITLSSGVEVVTFNDQSQIIGQTTVDQIKAAESRLIRVESDEEAKRMAASSKDCPEDVVVSTDNIKVTN